MRRIAHGLAMLAVVSLGAAQGPTSSGSVKARIPTQQPPAEKQPAKPKPQKPYQIGTASWYGSYFQGKETASGRPYDMFDLTAAHPTLPLGTFVKVTNLRNHRSVVVQINDRGPVVAGRIIDVSYQTAKVLQFKGQGLQRVRLDIVPSQTEAELHPLAY